MNFREAQPVYTVDLGSGRVHQRVYIEGRLLTDERDNLDDAGDFKVIDSIEGVEPEYLCKRCFPQPEPAA